MDPYIKAEWQHPTLGCINETVCLDHLLLVTGAVDALGIGALYETAGEDDTQSCHRCLAGTHTPPSQWLPSCVRHSPISAWRVTFPRDVSESTTGNSRAIIGYGCNETEAASDATHRLARTHPEAPTPTPLSVTYLRSVDDD